MYILCVCVRVYVCILACNPFRPHDALASSRTCCLLVFAAVDIGCWIDTADRALLGGPQANGYTVETCKGEALARGSTIFALQAGGWCTTSTGTDNYTKHGKASVDPCPALGGPWVNHVFAIVGGLSPSPRPPPRSRGANPSKGRAGFRAHGR
jgi:hypothetical protein